MPSLHIEGDGRILSDRAPWGPVNCEYVVSRQFGVGGVVLFFGGQPTSSSTAFWSVSRSSCSLFLLRGRGSGLGLLRLVRSALFFFSPVGAISLL